MDGQLSVQRMTDEQILTIFGTAEDPAHRGFDDETQARILAYELVRARSRVAFYRALYGALLDAGKPFMIENLDESDDGAAIPAKLVFSDDADHVAQIQAVDDVVVWTEPDLLAALVQERAVLDYYTDLLDELEPRLPN